MLFIPVLSVVWSLILNHISGPHFLSRSDPEYVYLLNGLNVATGNLDRIGHVDHPGTPFQLITGIFIAVIYWISGSGSMVSDVIINPEKYLFISSFLLALLAAYVIYRISKLEYKRSGSVTGAMIIPFSLLLYMVIIDLPSRYIPDQLLMIILLFYAELIIRYLYDGYKARKFAIYSGVLMAAGVMTKINFAPFFILPLFLLPGWKLKRTYGIAFGSLVVVLFLLIHHKFNEFVNFALKVSTHDGLYGGGQDQFLNPEAFWNNLIQIIKDNPALMVILVVTVISLFLLWTRKDLRKAHRGELSFLSGFVLVSVISIFIVAKHYKNYYIIPALSISGLAWYMIWMISRRSRMRKLVPLLFLVVMIASLVRSGQILVPGYTTKANQKIQELATGSFIQMSMSPKDYLCIQPTDLSGPILINGLVYGITYINHPHRYYLEYEKAYPNVITYEGQASPLKYFRIIAVDNESLLKSGRDIYLLSTPGRNAFLLFNYLDSCATAYDVQLQLDTVYHNTLNNNLWLRVRNASGWTTLQDVACGFEISRGNIMYSDDGQFPMEGECIQIADSTANGSYAIRLGKGVTRSPGYVLTNVQQGDRIELIIKRGRSGGSEDGLLAIQYSDQEGRIKNIRQEKSLAGIHPRWELVRMNLTVEEEPADGRYFCYYEYRGEGTQVADDLVIRHFSKQWQ